jgi:hypothetical protein
VLAAGTAAWALGPPSPAQPSSGWGVEELASPGCGAEELASTGRGAEELASPGWGAQEPASPGWGVDEPASLGLDAEEPASLVWGAKGVISGNILVNTILTFLHKLQNPDSSLAPRLTS